jgi:hypothetical protein
MDAETIIGIVLLVLGGSFYSIFVFGKIFRKKIGHDILGWHDCDIEGNDGCSNVGTCKYCGKKCLQDSQGNWF